MGDRGAPPIARLTKHHVERLLADYDGDPVGALAAALRVVLDDEGATFDELIARADFDAARAAALVSRDMTALDDLAAELNEQRDLPGPSRPAV